MYLSYDYKNLVYSSISAISNAKSSRTTLLAFLSVANFPNTSPNCFIYTSSSSCVTHSISDVACATQSRAYPSFLICSETPNAWICSKFPFVTFTAHFVQHPILHAFANSHPCCSASNKMYLPSGTSNSRTSPVS